MSSFDGLVGSVNADKASSVDLIDLQDQFEALQLRLKQEQRRFQRKLEEKEAAIGSLNEKNAQAQATIEILRQKELGDPGLVGESNTSRSLKGNRESASKQARNESCHLSDVNPEELVLPDCLEKLELDKNTGVRSEHQQKDKDSVSIAQNTSPLEHKDNRREEFREGFVAPPQDHIRMGDSWAQGIMDKIIHSVATKGPEGPYDTKASSVNFNDTLSNNITNTLKDKKPEPQLLYSQVSYQRIEEKKSSKHLLKQGEEDQAQKQSLKSPNFPLPRESLANMSDSASPATKRTTSEKEKAPLPGLSINEGQYEEIQFENAEDFLARFKGQPIVKKKRAGGVASALKAGVSAEATRSKVLGPNTTVKVSSSSVNNIPSVPSLQDKYKQQEIKNQPVAHQNVFLQPVQKADVLPKLRIPPKKDPAWPLNYLPKNLNEIRELGFRPIPPDVTAAHILERFFAAGRPFGMIHRIIMDRPEREIRIFFVEPCAAKAAYIHYHEQGLWIKTAGFTIKTITTHTNEMLVKPNGFLYNKDSKPIEDVLHKKVYQDGLTRVIYLINIPPFWSDQKIKMDIMEILKGDYHDIFERFTIRGRDVEIRFLSIELASRAYVKLGSNSDYVKVGKQYGIDPAGGLNGIVQLPNQLAVKFSGEYVPEDKSEDDLSGSSARFNPEFLISFDPPPPSRPGPTFKTGNVPKNLKNNETRFVLVSDPSPEELSKLSRENALKKKDGKKSFTKDKKPGPLPSEGSLNSESIAAEFKVGDRVRTPYFQNLGTDAIGENPLGSTPVVDTNTIPREKIYVHKNPSNVNPARYKEDVRFEKRPMFGSSSPEPVPKLPTRGPQPQVTKSFRPQSAPLEKPQQSNQAAKSDERLPSKVFVSNTTRGASGLLGGLRADAMFEVSAADQSNKVEPTKRTGNTHWNVDARRAARIHRTTVTKKYMEDPVQFLKHKVAKQDEPPSMREKAQESNPQFYEKNGQEDPQTGYFKRSVQVSNLPPRVSISNFLLHVRGGAIEFVKIDYEKSEGIVVFVTKRAAKNYLNYMSKHEVAIGDYYKPIKVRELASPLGDKEVAMLGAAFGTDRSRVLYIYDVNPPPVTRVEVEDFASILRKGFPNDPELIESKNNSMRIRFCNIDNAISFREYVFNHSRFKGCQVYFEKDPCDGPMSQIHQAKDIMYNTLMRQTREAVKNRAAENNDNKRYFAYNKFTGEPIFNNDGKVLDQDGNAIPIDLLGHMINYDEEYKEYGYKPEYNNGLAVPARCPSRKSDIPLQEFEADDGNYGPQVEDYLEYDPSGTYIEPKQQCPQPIGLVYDPWEGKMQKLQHENLERQNSEPVDRVYPSGENMQQPEHRNPEPQFSKPIDRIYPSVENVPELNQQDEEYVHSDHEDDFNHKFDEGYEYYEEEEPDGGIYGEEYMPAEFPEDDDEYDEDEDPEQYSKPVSRAFPYPIGSIPEDAPVEPSEYDEYLYHGPGVIPEDDGPYSHAPEGGYPEGEDGYGPTPWVREYDVRPDLRGHAAWGDNREYYINHNGEYTDDYEDVDNDRLVDI